MSQLLTSIVFLIYLYVLILFINKKFIQAEQIIKGYTAKRGQFPYFAQLEVTYHKNGRSNSIICGATLISPQWILTAAHCFPETQSEVDHLEREGTAVVYMGTIKRLDWSAKLNPISGIFTHTKYVHFEKPYLGDYMENDIAVAKLREKYTLNKYIQTIHLPSHGKSINKKRHRCQIGVIIGTGTIRFNSTMPDYNVKYAHIKSKEHRELPVSFATTDSVFFSPVRMRRGHTYSADLGGPYVCYIGKTPIQFGVISFLANHTVSAYVGYESVQQHLSFILSIVPDIKIYGEHSGHRRMSKLVAYNYSGINKSGTVNFKLCDIVIYLSVVYLINQFLHFIFPHR